MLMPIKKAADREYPLSWEDTQQDNFDGNLPWAELRMWIEGIGGQANGPRGYVVDYGEDGIIYFSGARDEEECGCIGLDMHADWKHALAAFRKLFALDPNCCILDEQTGIYYDPSTFEQFIEQCKRDSG